MAELERRPPARDERPVPFLRLGDAEYTLETPPWVPDDRTGVGGASSEADSPARIYRQLRENAEWRLLFADRVQKQCFDGGALTTNQTIPRFLRLCDEIDGAIVCESARWGDVVRRTQPYTRNVEWLAEKSRLLTQFFPQRTERVIQQCRNAGLYPNLAAPAFSSPGGLFTNQLLLTVSVPAGRIYYTTDGSDPRLPGGAINATAQLYSRPLTLTSSQRLRARAWQTNTWSASNEAVFLEAGPLPLRITEIMYHPAPTSPESGASPDDFQFIEVRNIGAVPLDLTGYRFTAGITFTFTNPVLPPGGFAVAVKNRGQFESRYGTNAAVAGEFSGTLSHNGERLCLEGPLGEVVQDFTYADWYAASDGSGFSLVITDENAPLDRWNIRSSWRISSEPNGSPGAEDQANQSPVLTIGLSGPAVAISWPLQADGFVFETTVSLSPPQWQAVPDIVGNGVTVTPGDACRFYRLRRP